MFKLTKKRKFVHAFLCGIITISCFSSYYRLRGHVHNSFMQNIIILLVGNSIFERIKIRSANNLSRYEKVKKHIFWLFVFTWRTIFEALSNKSSGKKGHFEGKRLLLLSSPKWPENGSSANRNSTKGSFDLNIGLCSGPRNWAGVKHIWQNTAVKPMPFYRVTFTEFKNGKYISVKTSELSHLPFF